MSFGIGLACSGDNWFGYTGGLNGYNTAGYNTAEYHSTKTDDTILVCVDVQAAVPPPGVANGGFSEIAHFLDPSSHPFSSKTGTI